jgi:glycine dehydrogenase subunit 2
VTPRRYHAAVWDEPLVLELGAPGRRGVVFEEPDADVDELVPAGLRRTKPPGLPELSEPEVLRHYLHLSQETLGMMGVSLFGTCTMKYNPRLATELVARPEIAEVHPDQDDDTLQGILELVHGLELVLRGVSGMDAFVFQPGGGPRVSRLARRG